MRIRSLVLCFLLIIPGNSKASLIDKDNLIPVGIGMLMALGTYTVLCNKKMPNNVLAWCAFKTKWIMDQISRCFCEDRCQDSSDNMSKSLDKPDEKNDAEMEEFLPLFKENMAEFLSNPCFGKSKMYAFYRENRDKIGRCIKTISPIHANFFLFLCSKDDFEFVLKSIQCGYKDVNAFYETSLAHEVCSDEPQIEDVKPIHFACYYGNKDMIDVLLEKGATLNDPDSNGVFPLVWACESLDGLQIVDHIIRKGGGIFYRDSESRNIELANLEWGLLDTLGWIFDERNKDNLCLMPGDCEKICRNISLLFQFTEDDLVFFNEGPANYRNDNKKFELPWKLVSGAERQLMQCFDNNNLSKELSIKILKMTLIDKADQLLERIPFDRLKSCDRFKTVEKVNELRCALKKKIIADGRKKIDMDFQSFPAIENSALIALKS